ncbi:hypothetical protein BH10ACT11_BH10ACT11_06830 [soil metagenome]
MAAAAICCAALLLTAPTQAHAGSQKCGNATATLGDGKKKVRNGVECLIAKARTKAHRHSLKKDGSVRGVSKAHAKTMVKTNCFRHVCTGEGSIQTRLKESGYLDGVRTYGFGEDTGCAKTPKAMVTAWLESGYHRKNLLGRKFRDIGTGITKGAPEVQPACQGKGFMTFSVLFTWRKG